MSFSRYDEVIDKVDGVVGWLTLFGNYHAIRGLSFEDALRATVEEGGRIMVNELKHFLEDKANKALYVAIIQALRVANRWGDLKAAVSAMLGEEVGDREFTNALNALVNYNFVEKRGKGEYTVTDPLLRQINLTPLLRRVRFQ
jgi:hypothetical protein